MEQKKFALIVKIVSIASACVVFALALIAVVQFFQIGEAKSKASKLKAQLAYTTQERYNISEAIAKQKDAANAEKYARDQLGWIEDGDIIYES